MKSVLLLASVFVFSMGIPLSAELAKKPKSQPATSVMQKPIPKDMVSMIRRIAVQSLEDLEQRLSTDDIAKLAPYREDPDTTRELLVSILQDRIGSIRLMYSREFESVGPDMADKWHEMKSEILKRGIRRLNNWRSSWTSEDVEKMLSEKKDTVTP